MSRNARMARTGAADMVLDVRVLLGARAVEQLQHEQRQQDQSALQLIARGGVATVHEGAAWLDTRPMLDLREVHPDTADEAAQALQYAADRGLITVHAQAPHLVRVTRRPL